MIFISKNLSIFNPVSYEFSRQLRNKISIIDQYMLRSAYIAQTFIILWQEQAYCFSLDMNQFV